MISLNLFYKQHKSSEATLTKERYTTRAYLLLFTATFTILLLYNTFAQHLVTVYVQQPTEATYEHLAASFASSLQCPCSNIAIIYSSFVQSTKIRLHQICSSPFVQNAWIESIFGDGDWTNLAMNEFRSRGVAYFQLLQMLCKVAQQSIDGAVVFIINRIIYSSQSIPRMQLLSNVNTAITEFQRSFMFAFSTPLQCGRDSIHGNQLLTAYSTNWVFSPRYDTNMSYYSFATQPVSHGSNCSCATSSACTEPVFLNGQMIPGFVLGCIPFESLVRSTLVCLYNQTCVDLINTGDLPAIQLLNASLSSQYSVNATVDELVKNMLVEEWSFNISYSNFFNECKPAVCTYLISEQNGILQIITITLGFYGGLRTILHVTTPYLIAIFDRIALLFWKRTNRVIPSA